MKPFVSQASPHRHRVRRGLAASLPRRWPLSLLLLSWALASVGALAAERGALEANGLTVIYDEPLRGVAEEAARIYPQTVADLENRLGLAVPPNPVLVLVGDAGLFHRMVEGRPILAFAVPEKNLVVADGSRVGRDPFGMEETIRHELTHLIVHHHVAPGRIPRWLDEGLAQWASEGLGELLSAGRKSILRQALLSDRLIRIRTLDDWFPTGGGELILAYEESESLVGFIIGRYGMAGIVAILNRLKAGDEWEAAIGKSLGPSFAEIEKDWLAELQKERSWLLLLSPYLYEILFALAALASAVGFLRAYLRKRAYFRDQEEEDSPD